MRIEAKLVRVPSLPRRRYKLRQRLKIEAPHLAKASSEYAGQHVWLTTQPMKEPTNRAHVLDAPEWITWDRVLSATVYLHRDHDDQACFLPDRTVGLYGAR